MVAMAGYKPTLQKATMAILLRLWNLFEFGKGKTDR